MSTVPLKRRGDTTVSQAYYIYIHARFLPLSAFYTLHLGIKLMATCKFQSGVSKSVISCRVHEMVIDSLLCKLSKKSNGYRNYANKTQDPT